MVGLNGLFGKKKSPKQDEIVESFQNSFENENAIDFAIETVDLAVDKFVDSAVVNGIPVLGLLNSVYKVYKNVQAYRLAKKVYIFLYNTHDIAADKKRQFVEEYVNSNQEDGVDALLSVIDQMDNQNKVGIMANLLRAKIDGKITIYDFNRVVACLQRIPFSDINNLWHYLDDCYEPGITDVLYTAGLLFLSHEDFEKNTNEYKLNYNGALLLKYGVGKDIQIPTDFTVKRLSFVRVEDVSEMIEDAKPRLEDDTLIFPDGTKSGKNEDDGQFLYDLARGK